MVNNDNNQILNTCYIANVGYYILSKTTESLTAL